MWHVLQSYHLFWQWDSGLNTRTNGIHSLEENSFQVKPMLFWNKFNTGHFLTCWRVDQPAGWLKNDLKCTRIWHVRPLRMAFKVTLKKSTQYFSVQHCIPVPWNIHNLGRRNQKRQMASWPLRSIKYNWTFTIKHNRPVVPKVTATTVSGWRACHKMFGNHC